MSWKGIGAAFALVIATTGACSLFIPVPTDEYSNGAVVTDDGGTVVSPGDAEAGSSTPPSAGCDASFCEHFDDGSLGSKWDRKETHSAELMLVPSTIGPPNALEMHLPEQPAGNRREAFLEKRIPTPKHARCAFDVLAAKLPEGSEDAELIGLRAKTKDDADYTTLVNVGREWSVRDEADGASSIASAVAEQVPVTGKWTHVVLDVEPGKTATLDVDGKTTALTLRPFAAETMTLTLGETGDSDPSEVTVLFDDVSCSFTQ